MKMCFCRSNFMYIVGVSLCLRELPDIKEDPGLIFWGASQDISFPYFILRPLLVALCVFRGRLHSMERVADD